ncbi:MAG: lysine--tRNA ligase [Methylococcales bacterium]|nr:lysine--tRNA ligase [Methylococcales bacterium]
MSESQPDEQIQIKQRREKLTLLREESIAFPTDFRREHLASELLATYSDQTKEELDETPIRVKLAGRIMTRRIMGKASFAHIQDMSSKIQLYVTRDTLPEGFYNTQFKKWDIGDIIGCEGVLFKTKVGELSIRVDAIRLLTKALRPLPEKFHGITDQEIKYRQRYLDLIMNPDSRKNFVIRSKIVSYIRQFLTERQFMEVETPMMQTIPGGATAKPFTTHHNALDMDLYLRVAPELYLKRLVVGGFERVFEVNRNFRNEGLSSRHNPEFTMLEFYQAYAEYGELMDLTEAMLQGIALDIGESTQVSYQGETYDFGQPFVRMTVVESILHFNPELTLDNLSTREAAIDVAEKLSIPIKESYGLGKVQIEIFEKTVEHRLMNPTFITAYPVEVSPLARRNDDDPHVTDRFEFFVGGREIANGFTELNDSEDQAQRFQQQVNEKDAGDDEAMHYDSDYITALEYGMPPTAGEGIGIDRLVMLFTDAPSIRDVLLFPHMRAKA